MSKKRNNIQLDGNLINAGKSVSQGYQPGDVASRWSHRCTKHRLTFNKSSSQSSVAENVCSPSAGKTQDVTFPPVWAALSPTETAFCPSWMPEAGCDVNDAQEEDLSVVNQDFSQVCSSAQIVRLTDIFMFCLIWCEVLHRMVTFWRRRQTAS